MIITISRQFGSGGREVGKRLADSLKCAYYDDELLQTIAEETGFAAEYIERNDEAATRSYSYTFSRTFANYQQSPTDKIQLAQAKLIKQAAAAGDGVFIGRCSDFILRDMDPFKVFIFSSEMEARIERCYSKVPDDRKTKNVKEMKKMILAVDKERARYHEYYTGEKWDNIRKYNLCIDTSKIGIKKTVELIVSAL